VSFTGSEAAYARLWLRGLLLTLLTLGFARPWARLACHRYLLQHTHVAGQALDDVRSPWPMLVRQCLALGLLAGIGLASVGSPLRGLLAATLGLLIWPSLKLMCRQHVWQHTTWARRPMAFDGRPGPLYRVMGLPLGGLALLVWTWLAVAWWGHATGWVLWGMGLGLWLLTLPMWCWGWLHFRQSHLRLGPLRMQWRVGPATVSVWMLQTLGAALLVLALHLGLATAVLGALLWWQRQAGGMAFRALGVAQLAVALLALSLWLTAARVWPEACARLHKLVWNRTGDRHLRLRCRLSVAAYARMRARHGLLLLLTAGLYWPWATVQSRRMRLNATVVQSRVGIAALAARWPVK